MAELDNINDVTSENFEALIAQASMQHPVLVDFWASWCGPCQALSPILEKLVAEYGGAFTVAKINADDEQALAAQFQIRSLPTVLLVSKGEIVEHFMGLQPESAIREILDRHVQPLTDEPPSAAAGMALASDDPEQALAALQQQIEAEPDNHPLKVQAAGLLLTLGATDQSRQLFEQLPNDARDSDQAKSLAARLHFAEAVSGNADVPELTEQVSTTPDNLNARYQLGVRMVVAGHYEGGLEHFYEIMKRDRKFEEDLGRKSLVEAFAVIDDPALVGRYRQRMTSLLF